MQPFEPSSFRDPSGWVFRKDAEIYRQVNACYQSTYQACQKSGIYQELWDRKLLVKHLDIGPELCLSQSGFTVLRPEKIPFISYPYEWSFELFRAAALCTLDVMDVALKHGLILKDASAYNIQFVGPNAVFIDTLSFELYQEGHPWVAYRQFCQHFLAPLYLMAYCDANIGTVLRSYLDGFPLDLTSKWLPWRTRWSLGALAHIHFHAKSKSATDTKLSLANPPKVSKLGLIGICENLRSCVVGLKSISSRSVWKAYYDDNNYTDKSMTQKLESVEQLAKLVQPKPLLIWDCGANTGKFSRLLASESYAIAMDFDPACVDRAFLEAKREQANILPLVMDFANPSPSLGWAHQERMSLLQRGPADLALALALIHHLRISANVPMAQIARFFAQLCGHLIIEFVPKEDSQVQRLLQTRPDTFDDYDEGAFRQAFENEFQLVEEIALEGSHRKLFLWRLISSSGQ
jgi:hypothetical protein